MELTILIPALNEEKTIRIVIDKAYKFITDNNINGEILVVNNGSTDKTKDISINAGARVIDFKHRGYGNALRYGIENAYGKYIIMGDADDSYNFLEIEEFLRKLREGYELVMGNRFGGRMDKKAMKWSHKYIGTPILTFLINKKCKLNLNDINCGLRGFNKEKILNLNLDSEGMEFASEMIIKASKADLKILEIPINFYKDKRNKKSHLNGIRDGIKHINTILNKY